MESARNIFINLALPIKGKVKVYHKKARWPKEFRVD
jgi:hypothetical protein